MMKAFIYLKVAVVFISVSILFSQTSFAQKCKYEKNQIDPITKVSIKRTVPEQIMRLNGQPLNIKAQCIGESRYIKIRYYKNNEFALDEDKELIITLNNYKEIVLHPRPMNTDKKQTGNFQTISSLLVYKLSQDQFKQLKQTPVKHLQFSVDGQMVTYPVKDSKQTKLMYILRCVE